MKSTMLHFHAAVRSSHPDRYIRTSEFPTLSHGVISRQRRRGLWRHSGRTVLQH